MYFNDQREANRAIDEKEGTILGSKPIKLRSGFFKPSAKTNTKEEKEDSLLEEELLRKQLIDNKKLIELENNIQSNRKRTKPTPINKPPSQGKLLLSQKTNNKRTHPDLLKELNKPFNPSFSPTASEYTISKFFFDMFS